MVSEMYLRPSAVLVFFHGTKRGSHRFWSLRNKAAPSSGLLETLPMLENHKQRAAARAGIQLAGGRDGRLSELWYLLGRRRYRSHAIAEDYFVERGVVIGNNVVILQQLSRRGRNGFESSSKGLQSMGHRVRPMTGLIPAIMLITKLLTMEKGDCGIVDWAWIWV